MFLDQFLYKHSILGVFPGLWKTVCLDQRRNLFLQIICFGWIMPSVERIWVCYSHVICHQTSQFSLWINRWNRFCISEFNFLHCLVWDFTQLIIKVSSTCWKRHSTFPTVWLNKSLQLLLIVSFKQVFIFLMSCVWEFCGWRREAKVIWRGKCNFISFACQHGAFQQLLMCD